MEPTSDIRMVDHGNEFLIGAAFEVAVALAQVNVDKHLALWRCHGDNCTIVDACFEFLINTQLRVQINQSTSSLRLPPQMQTGDFRRATNLDLDLDLPQVKTDDIDTDTYRHPRDMGLPVMLQRRGGTC